MEKTKIKTEVDGSMAFIPEEVADGKHKKFVDTLMDLDAEVRIWSDGYCVIVDYIRRDLEGKRYKRFEVIDEENGDYIANWDDNDNND